MKIFIYFITTILIVHIHQRLNYAPKSTDHIKFNDLLNDTDTLNPLQILIDSFEETIDKTNYLDLRKLLLEEIAINLEFKKSDISDSLYKLKRIKGDSLILYNPIIKLLNAKHNYLNHEIDSINCQLDSTFYDRKSIINIYVNGIIALKNQIKIESSKYFFNVNYKNTTYTCIVANNDLVNVRILSNDFGYPVALSKFWQRLNHENTISIFNAGMFLPDGSAQGLLIENYVIKSKLDTSTGIKYGNFYLYPNGIFYLDQSNNYYIKNTIDFSESLNSNLKTRVKYATQSGPLLVLNNKIHKSFRYNSVSTYIRNGVGLVDTINNTKAFFVISKKPVNLFDFAVFFKDILGCRDALYLDGAISSLYYSNENNTFGSLDGNIGPIISIHKNK